MNKNMLAIAVTVAMATVGLVQAAPPSTDAAKGNQIHATLSSAQRGELVAKIVRTWGTYVQKVQGTSGGAWANRMQPTFNAATDANLQRAVGMKTFQGMMDALVGQHLTDAQVTDSLATQAIVLKSGIGPALLGSTTADLVYTPITPCRIADTRVAGGPIGGTFTRGFKGYSATNFAAQGGIATSNCGIPPSPSALMLNFTVVEPSLYGWLTVFPYGTTLPLAANLNYAPGQIVGNEIAAKMSIGMANDFSVYTPATANIVIDAVGYFMAPQATTLDTIRVDGVATDIAANTDGAAFTPSCPTGYTQMNTYCSSAYGKPSLYLLGVGVGGCAYRNYAAVAYSQYAYIQCARIPGR